MRAAGSYWHAPGKPLPAARLCGTTAIVRFRPRLQPRMASSGIGMVGLADVLWRDFQQSPSRRPKQRERLQWPYPRHLRGKGCMKAADGGGNGVRAASKAWEQAHRHLCVIV